MTYQIDQSIKIENTSKTTYVSLVNGESITVSITAKNKRELKVFFRELGKPLIFKIFTFAVLCATTIIKSKSLSITIDSEYTGHERQIKSFILQIFKIKGHKVPEINFSRIGKSSHAHEVVHHSLEKKYKGFEVNAKQVVSYYDRVNKA